MKSTLSTARLRLLAVPGILIAALALAAPRILAREAAPPGWSPQEIELRWGPPVSEGDGLNFIMYHGWDGQHRYYAARPLGSAHGDRAISVIDQVGRRVCTMAAAEWTHGDFRGGNYELTMWNDAGWSASTVLDLTTWQVSVIVHSACHGASACAPVRYPLPEPRGICQPDRVYQPEGLS